MKNNDAVYDGATYLEETDSLWLEDTHIIYIDMRISTQAKHFTLAIAQ